MGRVLGIDYGSVRVGIAISDELRLIARGLPTIKRDPAKKKWAFISAIKDIVIENDVETIVIGLPLKKDGARGESANETLLFADKLRQELKPNLPGMEIILKDERFTSAMAERVLLEADVSRRRRKEVIDACAAVIILQGYLDSLRIEG